MLVAPQLDSADAEHFLKALFCSAILGIAIAGLIGPRKWAVYLSNFMIQNPFSPTMLKKKNLSPLVIGDLIRLNMFNTALIPFFNLL